MTIEFVMTSEGDEKPYVNGNRNWLNPLDKIRWVKAFRARKTQVTLRSGRIFDIEYKTLNIFSLSETQPVKVAWVTEKDGEGSGPCGYFRLDEVTQLKWVWKTEMCEGYQAR